MPEPIEKMQPGKQWFFVYLSSLGAILFLSLIIWNTASFFPKSKSIRELFLGENNLVEMISILFLVGALVFALRTLLRNRPFPKPSPYWWLFPITIFLLICEETSFGRTYYHWYTVPKICGAKFDALHDLLIIFPHCLPQLGISKSAFFLTALVLGIAALFFIIRFILKQRMALLTSLKTYPAWLYLIFTFFILWLGGGLEVANEIDFLHVGGTQFPVFLEETFEMLAEYSILFSAIVFYRKQ